MDTRAASPTVEAPALEPADAALEVLHLSHAFGARQVLRDVSFTIAAGDFTVLLGLNGAGKTTLFSLITRLYAHRSGVIRIFGWDVRRHSSAALARIGVVFQQPTLDLDLSVAQNLYYHAALHGLAPRHARQRIERELQRMQLSDRLGDRVRELSGGQRRRVEIVRALLHEPRLLLLDEPTVGLDIASRQFLLDHVRMLCREQHLAVLWATHLIDEVTPQGQVLVLHRGALLAQGPVPEVVRMAKAETMRGAFDLLTRESS
jgi:ABC-2 type transport system ATP-binding protein